MAEHGTSAIHQEIQLHNIDAAIALGQYLVPHADAVLRMMDAAGAGSRQAMHVLRWIRRHEAERFTERELWRHLNQRFGERGELDAVLAELQDRGYIRKVEEVAQPKGGRPSPSWDVNPLAHGAMRPIDKTDETDETPEGFAETESIGSSVSDSSASRCDPPPLLPASDSGNPYRRPAVEGGAPQPVLDTLADAFERCPEDAAEHRAIWEEQTGRDIFGGPASTSAAA